MKKVAFLLPDVEPYNSFYGGACARWVANVIPFKPKDEIAISVLGRGHKQEYIYDHHLVINPLSSLIARFKKLIPFNNNKYDGLMWCVSWMLHFRKFDTIIVENRSHYIGYLRSLGFKGKLILHMHNDRLDNVSELFLGRINKQTDHIISCSHSIIDNLQYKLPSLFEKSVVIYNGVDETLFKKREDQKIPYSILFVGRFDENKGLHVLVEALNMVKQELPRVQLNIVGASQSGGDQSKSEYERKIFEQIEALDLKDNISFLGYLDHDTQLPSIFNQHCVFCLTSVYTEAFPLVVIESLFSNTPVIASNVGGVSEAFYEKYEGLVETQNAKALAKKILSVLNNSDSEVYTHSFKFAIENFRWETIAKNFFAFIEKT